MKIITACMLFLSLSTVAKVEFKVSPVHGLVKFIEFLGEDNIAYWNLIKKEDQIFVRGKVNQFIKTKNTYLISRFSIGETGDKGDSGGNIWHVIIWQSILSKN